MKVLRIITIISLLLSISVYSQKKHPNLVLNSMDIAAIKKNWKKYPEFREIFTETKNKIDAVIGVPMDVPVPADAGGYTHEKHKQNYNEMYLSGFLFSVTGEKKYAEFVKNMLFRYSELYPTLKKHPMATSKSSGKLFWQTLNECVWTIHTSMAYDFIYDYLTTQERQNIEDKLLRPVAKFLANDRADDINLIHNHGTWACTAIGFAGFVLNDDELVQKGLKGTEKDGKYGYLAQLNSLISPDGYYTEGGYYVRYVIWPMIYFARAINNNMPELKIFEYREQILRKLFYGAINLTYTNGGFVTINDALKDKDYLSPEIVIALNTICEVYGMDTTLLGIANRQKRVMLSKGGLIVAEELSKRNTYPEYNYKSIEYSDGGKGDEGGIGFLRYGAHSDLSQLLMKYTGHGLSHGHYDKLSIAYYDQNREILQDYGAARFLNVETKDGGRYLPETKAFCMQTIAHNTVTIDEKSHYGGKISVSETKHAEKHFFDSKDKNCQIVSAKVSEVNAGVGMQRTSVMIKDEKLPKPVVLDVFKVSSEQEHQYDLPFYYLGQLINANIDYTPFSTLRKPLGQKNGYQYLWKTAEGKGNGEFFFSFMNGNRYYSVITNADPGTDIIFAQIGANDSNFNLRNDPGVILRTKAKSHVFASVIEPHGSYDGVNETSKGAIPHIEKVKVLFSDKSESIIHVLGKNGIDWILMLNNGESSDNKEHKVKIGEDVYEWKGNYSLIKKGSKK